MTPAPWGGRAELADLDSGGAALSGSTTPCTPRMAMKFLNIDLMTPASSRRALQTVRDAQALERVRFAFRPSAGRCAARSCVGHDLTGSQ